MPPRQRGVLQARRELTNAEKIETRDFEKGIYFESCLACGGYSREGDRYPEIRTAKPVGLKDPRTGKTPFAVIQLRAENAEGTMFNIVGFQTKLRYPEQRRIFRMIPGLENAEFMRYGSVHRNTYINSPSLLRPTLQTKADGMLFFAGQIVGVEGYAESAAMGIIAGINAARLAAGNEPIVPPRETAIGSLLCYITDVGIKKFQPMNINFGLFPALPGKVRKAERKGAVAERALSAMGDFARA